MANAARKAATIRSRRIQESGDTEFMVFGIVGPRSARSQAQRPPLLNADASRTCTFETLGCSRSVATRRQHNQGIWHASFGPFNDRNKTRQWSSAWVMSLASDWSS